MRVTLRIFTHRAAAQHEHSYIIGAESGGLSERYAELVEFDPERDTLESLRVKIEVTTDRGMNRRTALFQEMLQVRVRGCRPPIPRTHLDFRAADRHPSNPVLSLIVCVCVWMMINHQSIASIVARAGRPRGGRCSAREVIQTAPNPHKWPPGAAVQYRFGLFPLPPMRGSHHNPDDDEGTVASGAAGGGALLAAARAGDEEGAGPPPEGEGEGGEEDDDDEHMAILRALMPGGSGDPKAVAAAPMPRIVSREDEENHLVVDMLGDPNIRDVIIVPQTQIDRFDRCTPHPLPPPLASDEEAFGAAGGSWPPGGMGFDEDAYSSAGSDDTSSNVWR